jgi:hypothetical protein
MGNVMNLSSPDNYLDNLAAVTRCRIFGIHFTNGLMTFKEYAHTLTLMILTAPDECMPECVKTIPAEFIAEYTEYLRAWLTPLNFMPDPRPFLTGIPSDEIIEQKKKELMPRYVRLYHLMLDRRQPHQGLRS